MGSVLCQGRSNRVISLNKQVSTALHAEISSEAESKFIKSIDSLILKKLAEKKISPTPKVSEDTFLRRAYLDIAGRIPTLSEYEDYNSDGSTEKRTKLIIITIEVNSEPC